MSAINLLPTDVVYERPRHTGTIYCYRARGWTRALGFVPLYYCGRSRNAKLHSNTDVDLQKDLLRRFCRREGLNGPQCVCFWEVSSDLERDWEYVRMHLRGPASFRNGLGTPLPPIAPQLWLGDNWFTASNVGDGDNHAEIDVNLRTWLQVLWDTKPAS